MNKMILILILGLVGLLIIGGVVVSRPLSFHVYGGGSGFGPSPAPSPTGSGSNSGSSGGGGVASAVGAATSAISGAVNWVVSIVTGTGQVVTGVFTGVTTASTVGNPIRELKMLAGSLRSIASTLASIQATGGTIPTGIQVCATSSTCTTVSLSQYVPALGLLNSFISHLSVVVGVLRQTAHILAGIAGVLSTLTSLPQRIGEQILAWGGAATHAVTAPLRVLQSWLSTASHDITRAVQHLVTPLKHAFTPAGVIQA